MNMLLTVKEEGNLPGIEICCTRNLPIRRHISHSTVTSLKQQQPQPQIQSQINQPKSSPLFQQQGGAVLPTNTPAQCGGSDGNQYKPQHKLAKYFDKGKGPLCFNCQKWGHLAAGCPDRNVFAVSTDNQGNTTLAPTFMPKLFLVGSIFGKPVRFLLDSGADHSLINSNVTEQFKQWNLPVPDPSGSIMTKCFRGQSMSNLTVVLPCLLSGSEISVNMAVTDNLDHDALLGPDYNFPRTNMSHQTDPDSDTDSSGEADMQQNNAANLIQDQRADETLKELWKSANKEDSPFMTNKGVLMRKTKDKLGEPYTQVIVPQSRRLEVLKLAHSAPAAGHTGAHRTKFKVLKNFFWPGIGKETTQFCRSCERCQRTAKRTNNHAPLTITNPPICRPFQKVAIDIVGPLPLTLGKNQFILSYIDVGSRYPEAIPLKKTTAIEVGKALMNIMSRLSVPEEFLSDRGSNFLSAVLKEAFKFLGVHHSKTAPYHPQSNGAVERFHHTLFQMIRSSSQEGQHWDELLPCLLFACREAPCSTTGFSPFELVFGKHVRGPLDILRQSWTPNSRSPQLATDWLLKLRDDLHKMRKLAADQQATTQERTKRWHDQTAKTITFSQETSSLSLPQSSQGARPQNSRTDGKAPSRC